MRSYIINIGDELLIGQVVNTNASWMAENLNKNNIAVGEIVVVGDDADAIRRHVQYGLDTADVTIITGGLGPTKDDITKKTLSDMFGCRLVTHEETLEHVRDYFSRRNLPMLEVNNGQALVLEGCTVLFNKMGTAPGMWFERGGKVVISLPGVPFEMKWLMDEYVIPRLTARLGHDAIVHKTVLTCGIGESFLAEKIAPWEDALPQHIRLAYLPSAGEVRLRLSAYGSDHEALAGEIEDEIAKLKAIIGDNIYGYDNDTFASVIGDMLRRRKARLGTAESCTGGLLANKITQIAGASDYYVGGMVSYSNEAKVRRLNVNPNTIEQYGAVSRQTAVEMARGCLSCYGVDYAIATTGIAGPGGGSAEKPVGTVYIAVASRDDVHCEKYVFSTTRVQHQERTANQALFDLWHFLKEKEN